MLEIVIEIFGEFLFQLVGEILIELGFHAMAEPFAKPSNPWLAVIGYFMFGAIVGGISLIFLPTYLVKGKGLRIANLLFTPICVGLAMSGLGAWRARHNQAVLRIDRFAYGFMFALGVALVRFWFAK